MRGTTETAKQQGLFAFLLFLTPFLVVAVLCDLCGLCGQTDVFERETTVFQKIMKLALGEADGNRAFDDLVNRWTIDRWFSFNGMLKSCEYSVAKMKQYGFDEAKVEKFPADGKTTFGYWRMPYAWDPTDATLTIVAPEQQAGKVLAHYRSLPCSLAMWSPPTPKKGLTGAVVALERGDRDVDYKGVRVRGKFVLTNLRGASVRNQAIKRGALGVISDVCRHPFDMPDAVDWMNAWSDDPSGWGLTRGEKNIIGFQISHRQGQALRKRIAAGPVKLHATVDAKVYAGVMPAATALLKGRTHEEVLTLGHGAEQGANDNASGCACMIEALRILRTLIDAGKLERPRRGIRMLITWEIYATLAFFARHRSLAGRTVASICLDTVGERPGGDNPAMALHGNMESNASYTDAFRTILAEAMWPRERSAFRWTPKPFGLTDCVTSDPSIGIPTMWLGQVHHQHWHTSEDTLDRIDPGTLGQVAAYTATFLYFFANAGEAEAAWLAEAVSSDSRGRLAQVGLDASAKLLAAGDAEELTAAVAGAERRLGHLGNVAAMAVRSAERLAPKRRPVTRIIDEGVTMIEDAMIAECEHLAELADEIAAEHRWTLRPVVQEPSAEEKQAAKIIAQRTAFGPIAFDGIPLAKRKGLDDGRWGGPLMTVLNWCDGRRTLAEAMRLASGEMGRDLTGIVKQIRRCEKLGLVTIRKA